jgi:hypothetical protein
LVERIARHGAAAVHPLEEAVDYPSTMAHEVEGPMQHAIIEPLFHEQHRRRIAAPVFACKL